MHRSTEKHSRDSKFVDHNEVLLYDAISPTLYRRVQAFFTPAVLQNHPRASLRPTAYLDGLRGFAAFLVYIAHHLLSANGVFAPVEVAFGWKGKYNFITLPWVRLLFTGSHVAVAIFFVISGFVLSRGPLRLIHEKQFGDLSSSLASALCRRGLRLYVPVIGSTFMFMSFFHLFGIKPEYGLFRDNWYAECLNYVKELWHWTYIFRSKHKGYFTDHKQVREGWFDYNAHTWTIPIEVQGSIIVWIALMALSRTTPSKRMSILTIGGIYFLLQGSWFSFTFLLGTVLAEQDLLRHSALLPKVELPTASSRSRHTAFYWCLLVVGTYLAGPPAVGLKYMSHDMLAENPGWYYISKIIPSVYYDCTHFIYSIAAVMIVASIVALPELRKCFEGPVVQYLGRISFALYLVHGPILASLGQYLYQLDGKKFTQINNYDLEHSSTPNLWENLLPVPQVGPTGIDLAFWLPHIILLPVTLYVSELCTKTFDEPSIRIAAWLYRKLSQ